MKAFLFPGQGAQTASMATLMINTHPESKKIYDKAKNLLDIDLVSLSEEKLSQTRFSQLAIVVHSICSFKILEKEKEIHPSSAFAGFSLGEYTSLYATKMLSFEETLLLVKKRAELMQEEAKKNPGVMYAVIGLDEKIIENEILKHSDVFPVNYNCPGQIVIAGKEQATEKASQCLKDLGARRVIKLKVNGAFHTPLMEKASEKLNEYAKTLDFKLPSHPVYSNVTGKKIPKSENMSDYLSKHMLSPVRFIEEIINLRKDGYNEFIELGPGKVLSGFIKKI